MGRATSSSMGPSTRVIMEAEISGAHMWTFYRHYSTILQG